MDKVTYTVYSGLTNWQMENWMDESYRYVHGAFKRKIKMLGLYLGTLINCNNCGSMLSKLNE